MTAAVAVLAAAALSIGTQMGFNSRIEARVTQSTLTNLAFHHPLLDHLEEGNNTGIRALLHGALRAELRNLDTLSRNRVNWQSRDPNRTMSARIQELRELLTSDQPTPTTPTAEP